MSEDDKFVKAQFSALDEEIIEDMVKDLDEHHDIWKSLLTILPPDIRCKFSEEELENLRCVPGMAQRTPSGRLVQGLMALNATVEHFIFWLEKINMDKALMHIKPDESLEILEHPPASLLVGEGEPLHLHCCAKGFPKPSYQWAKGGRTLAQQTSSTLNLEKACLEDAGDYECLVRNVDRLSGKERAPCYSQRCHVTVAPSCHKSPTRGYPPRIDLQPVAPGPLVAQGASIVLKCKASGDRPISYQWFKDKADIPGEMSEELHLRHLVPDEETHSWKYYCLVENPWGRIFSDTIAITLDAPNDQTQHTARDKVALLFANEHYQHLESFELPSSDVATLAAILKRQNFRVMAYLDLTLSEMRNTLDLFCRQLDKGVYGLFYYAGHGFEEHGQCYMQPADATDFCLKEESLCVDLVAESMQRKSPTWCALLLDMCRERPPDQIRQADRTFQTDRFKNIFFGYATSFLGEAVEVQGHPNGLFMQYLQKHLEKKKSLYHVFYDVSQAMTQDKIASRSGQIPWVENNNWTSTTLCDPIVDPLPQKAALDAHWRACCACPKPKHYENSLLQFSMTFEPHKAAFCNAMTVTLHVHKLSSPTDIGVKLKATFKQGSGEEVAVTYSSASDAYTIRNLHRIRSQLCCELSLVDSQTGLELGPGLIAVLQLDPLPIRTLGLADNRLDDASLL